MQLPKRKYYAEMSLIQINRQRDLAVKWKQIQKTVN